MNVTEYNNQGLNLVCWVEVFLRMRPREARELASTCQIFRDAVLSANNPITRHRERIEARLFPGALKVLKPAPFDFNPLVNATGQSLQSLVEKIGNTVWVTERFDFYWSDNDGVNPILCWTRSSGPFQGLVKQVAIREDFTYLHRLERFQNEIDRLRLHIYTLL
jgi:hypothetical protein